MSAATRAAVNQQNATHSTGPRTEEGKNRSKLNALNHGLASNQVVLPHESREEYEALKASFEENHQPGSDLEHEFLGRMVDTWWRLQRAYRVETEFFSQRERAISSENESLAGDAALAHMFSDPKESAKMRLFMRYLAAAERAWNRAVADFEKAKKERLRAERELAILEAMENQSASIPLLAMPLPELPGYRIVERNGCQIHVPEERFTAPGHGLAAECLPSEAA